MDQQTKKLLEWDALVEQLKELKKLEMEMRKELFDTFFLDPKEGTMNVDLGDLGTLKGTYKLNRDVDQAAVPAVLDSLREIGVVAEEIFPSKYSLSTKGLKTLGEQGTAIAEEAFTSKPGAPGLSLVPPKKKG